MIVVRYFAVARERAGCSTEQLPLAAGTRVGALLEELVRLHPALGPVLPHLRIAVNQAFVALSEPVPEGAEVALIPPVAGGSGDPAFVLLETALSLDAVVKQVSAPGQGGVV